MLKQSALALCMLAFATVCSGHAAQSQQLASTAPSYVYVPASPDTDRADELASKRWLIATDPAALDVLRFWFEEWDQDRVDGGKGRYNDKWFPHGPLGAEGSKEIDREIRERYVELFNAAVSGQLDWDIENNPYENLAFILLIDQFARNMFRGTPESYAHDDLGLAAARLNVEKGFHRYYFTGYQRLFVVYPLMHHEALDSQEMCLYLLKSINEQQDYPYQFLNALQKGVEHYQMIFMFGRFPHRNERLGRPTTPQETAYVRMKGTPGFVDGSKW